VIDTLALSPGRADSTISGIFSVVVDGLCHDLAIDHPFDYQHRDIDVREEMKNIQRFPSGIDGHQGAAVRASQGNVIRMVNMV
jgi:hypothetical protein